MKNFISVIVPTYNEEKNIELLIPEIFNVFKNNKLDGEIIVVDDNSEDDTRNIVRKLSKKYDVKLIERPSKMGIGSAYKEGFKHAKGDLIFEMDADFSHDPSEIPKFVKEINTGFDTVIGTRYYKEGKRNDPLSRRIFPFIGNMLYKIMGSPVFDTTGGYRCYRKESIDNIDMKNVPDDFSFQGGILFKLLEKNAKISQVPIKFLERKFGKTKFSSKELLGNIKLLFNLFFNYNTSRIQFLRFCVVGGIGTIINLAVLYSSVEILKLWYLFGAAAGFAIAATSNFIMNKIWAFKNKESGVTKQYISFLTISIIGLAVNLIALYVLTEFAGIWYMFAQFISILIAMAINFLGSKHIVFRGK